MCTTLNYLWVGRLNENKDPMTVLSGFEKYLSVQPDAKLHFIYFTTDLLPEMERKIETNVLLKNAVFLHGQIPYDEMPVWYSAADFFISGSHREGGSYALFEAMSCGCIPIVTEIPPALTVIDNGLYGFYYPPGDANGLFEQMVVSADISAIEFSRSVESHFQQTMSPEAIADRLFLIAKGLTIK